MQFQHISPSVSPGELGPFVLQFHLEIQRLVAKSESPVENGGKHPTIHRVSTCFNHPKLMVQDFFHSTLRSDHCQVPRGALIGVVGATGAGKSSLLQAILGAKRQV